MKIKSRSFGTRTVVLIFALSICFAISALGQESNAANVSKWTAITTAGNQLRFSVPRGHLVDAEKRSRNQRTKIFAFESGVAIEIAYFDDDAKRRLGYIKPVDGEITYFEKGPFKGLVNFSRPGSKSYFQKIYLASDQGYYEIGVFAADEKSKCIERFLFSISVAGEPLFKGSKQNDSLDDAVSISTLQTSSEVLDAVAKKIDKHDTTRETKPFSEELKKYDYSLLSRQPISLTREVPDFRPEPGGEGFRRYTAVIKVNVLANGQIGKTTAYSDSDEKFIDSCVNAVRRLRFIPAQMDGKNVDFDYYVDFSLEAITFRTGR